MSILYAISIVYIAGEYDGPGFWTPIGICILIISIPGENFIFKQKNGNY